MEICHEKIGKSGKNPLKVDYPKITKYSCLSYPSKRELKICYNESREENVETPASRLRKTTGIIISLLYMNVLKPSIL